MVMSEDPEQEFVPQKKKTPSDEEKEKRRKKIVPGSLMKAEMRPGGGSVKPVDGDQVIYHCTIRTLDGVIVESTRSELGGKGNPRRHVLGKSKMILGLLEGIPSMLKGEVAMFKMKPELHYGEVDCPVAVSESFPKHDELHFEIELIDFCKVKLESENENPVAVLLDLVHLPRSPHLATSTENEEVILSPSLSLSLCENLAADIVVLVRLENENRAAVVLDLVHLPRSPHLATSTENEKVTLSLYLFLCENLAADIVVLVRLENENPATVVLDLVHLPRSPHLATSTENEEVISEDLGVVKKVINEGDGWESPREPYEVKAWISAKTGDGKLILSHTQGEPFFFTFGKSEVPKGLEMGIGTMTRKEKAVVYVSNHYLTQSPFMPVVEGLEEVQFEVELVHFIQVRDMLGDGRLIKRRIHDGRGEFPMDCPLHDSLLRIHYKAMILNEERTVFYDTRIDNNGQPLEFGSGEGLVPEGLEMCVRLMLPGEIALVTCPPDYAYDKFARPANVPEGAHIQWEIELLGFEVPKDWTGLNFETIMEEAEKIKSTGNRIFKEGKFELAKAKYEKVLREFNHVNPQDDEEGKIFLNSRNSLHLNVAACLLKMGECKKSIEACNKVLDSNPVHVKALYRRGMAYLSAGDFDEARSDFNKMITIDKSSEPDATAALLKLRQKEQEVERKAKRQFKGLFDKNPGEISNVGTDSNENPKPEDENHESGDGPDSQGDEVEEIHEAEPPRTGLFSRFWRSRLFTALGLQNRCSIL